MARGLSSLEQIRPSAWNLWYPFRLLLHMLAASVHGYTLMTLVEPAAVVEADTIWNIFLFSWFLSLTLSIVGKEPGMKVS